MGHPPPFWSVVGGAVAIAALGVTVTQAAPERAWIGWALIAFAIVIVILYVGWWGWWWQSGRRTQPQMPLDPGNASVVTITGNHNTVVILQRLQESGPVEVQEHGRTYRVEAVATDTLSITDEATATVTRATVTPEGSVLAKSSDAPLVGSVVEALALTAHDSGTAYDAVIKITKNDPE
jgi:hypothetical protein